MKNYKKRIIFTLVSLILFMAVSFGNIIQLFTDYLWFLSITYESVFLVKIVTQLILFFPVWLFFAFSIMFYLKMMYKKYTNLSDEEKIVIPSKKAKKTILIFSFIVGAVLSIGVVNMLWLDYLKFTNAVDFVNTDPIFNMNIRFYIFTLPFIKEILQILLMFNILLIITSTAFELTTSKVINVTPIEFSSKIGIRNFNFSFLSLLLKKIKVLLIPLFLIIGVSFYLHTYDLLYSTRGVAFGASYTDVTITLLAYRIYALISIGCAVLTFIAVKRNNIKLFLIGPIVLVVTMISFVITGEIVQKLVVEPDEITKEREFLEYNIEYTQNGFNLSSVDLIEFPYEDNITIDMIENNQETIKNIRINDSRPLQQTFNQIQSIRLYYEFLDIDVDRYYIDGEYTQVFLSPRELNQFKLDNKAMTWLNQFLKYTHGYGIVMSPVNRVTEEGQPVLLFKNIPPISSTTLNIVRPELYFGELTQKYIIVNSDEKEFDYPSGSDNVEAMYTSDTGIELNGFKKLLFSIRERSMKLLVSNNINKDSRIIINRNILQRANEIAPFLTYDEDPYIVLNEEDGKLYWIIDAYTETKYYPYSQIFSFNGREVNYIRNSVKVVVDAYDGETNFYIYDETDPIIKTFNNIYPELFKSKSEFPTGLVAHTRYPQQYFDLQANTYKKYHVDNPVVFYNGEDVWDVATEKYMADVQDVESNYVMFKIDEYAEFALILPYTPKGKPNMTSLLVARSDGEHYGEVFLYRFPKDKTVQGPIMIESRIDQDSVISPQFTLWGQQGSTILRGNVIVVPLENTLLYVEPIYIQSDNKNSLPEMKRVIIAHNDTIIMEQTLQQGLDKLLGKEIPVDTLERTLQELLDKINDKFILTKESLDALEILINELEEKVK